MENELKEKEVQEEGTEKKTYTQEEVDALLQQETDRRVTSALKKQELKNQEKVREAEKLSKMDAEQRYVHELEEREKAIAQKEAELALAENKNAAAKILAEKGLSLQLVDFVVAEDAETMNDKIKTLDKAFKQSVKDEVEKRLASHSPIKTIDENKTYSKKDFKDMSLAQMQELMQSSPELFEN